LFDQPLSNNLSKKVYVFLSPTRTNRDVVDARDGVVHRLASKETSKKEEIELSSILRGYGRKHPKAIKSRSKTFRRRRNPFEHITPIYSNRQARRMLAAPQAALLQ
jgi:hypothetical protein